MIKSIPGIRVLEIPFTGGVNESAASNAVPNEQALLMDNWRLSKDGTRIEKRLGLVEEVTNFAEDVYGYTTYYDATPNFCQLAILESQIKRKVGTGAWGSIHTFSGNIAHPIIPLEIQDKIFVINEVDSRVILSNGSDYQIGIAAPITLPTLTLSFAVDDTLPLSDAMNYANQGAMDAVWTDADAVDGVSTRAVSGPATQGPDGDAKYMKFDFVDGEANSYAKRTRSLTDVGNKFSITTALYFDAVGGDALHMGFHILVYNSIFLTHIVMDNGGVRIKSDDGDKVIATSLAKDAWHTWKFVIDGTDTAAPTIECFLDDVSKGTATFADSDTTADACHLYAEGFLDNINTPIIYMDSIYISGETGETANLEGTYRYAVSYARSGNFGCESNPIKSLVGSKAFVGAGLNDLTPGGTYTRAETKTYRVQIDTTGTPDKIKWSDDNGETWQSETLEISTTMYLPYGVTLTFGATTGHTATDYWYFTCYAGAACPVKQKVTISSIPVSSDAQVDQRKIYRTVAGGATFYWLTTINNNTTTTFTDNIPDSALGLVMGEDHDVMPNGKSAVWWDGRLWVSGSNCVYYSDVEIPEHFDLGLRVIKLRSGLIGDEIIRIIDYQDSLFIFKRRSTFMIMKKQDGTYGSYQIHKDFGFSAPWSVIEVRGLLMGYNDRGIEIYNGVQPQLNFGNEILTTLSTVDETKLDLIQAAHNPSHNEVLFSFPDRTGGNSAVTVVYNYISNAFFTFSFYKTPSCLSECKDSSKNYVLKMGTRDGYLDLCDSGYLDGATAISADIIKPWISIPEYGDIRRIELELEMPTNNTLTIDAYVNFDKDTKRTETLTGYTPSSTLRELRRVLFRKVELGQRGKYFNFRLRNSETMTGDLKLNKIVVYYRGRAMKEEISGD